jgi:type III secretory pathway lipoprotein EscJ
MNAPNIDLTAILTISLSQVPTMVIVALGVLYNNARITDLRVTLTDLINSKINGQTEIINAKSESLMQALLRVEGVLDARLKNVEERLKHIEERRP